MSVFSQIKDVITTKQAVQGYGIAVNRNSMCCCPFHNDKNPSMKVDNRFHCFACGADGDVINFVEKYYGLSPIEAAKKLNDDFNLGIDFSFKVKPTVKSPEELQRQKQKELSDAITKAFEITRRDYINILSKYHRLLWKWKRDYAPAIETEDANWHPFFVEACNKLDIVNELLDGLNFGSRELQIEIIDTYGREIRLLEERINKYE
ncbi:CHC2 zinc finger domain-containing protein [Butyrivibrio sp. INlla14]|uniref:CHC2 zinc finger domain-containing protein n=1 Tax=Butyrivibrio sp. INlla14 TaxID=1520808 RepID=UPI0008772143|nr:CHC2 zinc finger domain-containing protein [Butyrivibrio sp. INlla14]SCX96611.1 CHC2 zinc finger [Butyrivibrio sp. INlla14]